MRSAWLLFLVLALESVSDGRSGGVNYIVPSLYGAGRPPEALKKRAR